MSTITEEFAQLLHNLDIGTYTPNGTTGDIFLTSAADAPDSAIAIARYGGPEADSLLGWDMPSVQIRVRGDNLDPRVAENRAQQVYDALQGMASRHLPNGTWLLLCVGSGPAYMGRDLKGRYEFVCNFRTEIRNASAQRQ
jgi:hypothetical protein